MKAPLSFVVRTLRYLFYNTPVKHWRITELIYASVGRFLIGNDPFPIIQLNGAKLKANGKDVIVTAALANGNYEPFTLRIFRLLINDSLEKNKSVPCVFVDVGANIGLFTVTAALLSPRVQVFAFEPSPTSYQLLKENVEINRLTNVTTEQAAAGEKQGRASLDISSPQEGNHSIYSLGARRTEISVICLGDYFLEKQLFPSIIKVDVEGYEPRVLQGLGGFSHEQEIQIILEFNPEHLKRGGKDPLDFLEELVSQFNSVCCLDEIGHVVIPYNHDDYSMKQKILTVGYNLLLVRGAKAKLDCNYDLS